MTPGERVNATISNELLETLHKVLVESGVSHAAAIATAAALCADALATSHGPRAMKELALLEIQDFMLARLNTIIGDQK